MNHIAVLDEIVLSFKTPLACFFGARFATAFNEAGAKILNGMSGDEAEALSQSDAQAFDKMLQARLATGPAHPQAAL